MKNTLLVAALLTAGQAAAQPCEVATDAALDALPQHDVVSVTMTDDGEMLEVALSLTEFSLPSADTDYRVHWMTDLGVGYYVGFWLTAGSSVEAVIETEFGIWTPGSNAHDYIDFDVLEVSIEGSTIRFFLPLIRMGFPLELTMIGAQSDLWASGSDVVLDGTANDGVYTIGACGDVVGAAPGFKVADIGAAGGAGGLGLTILTVGLVALRRRRSV